MVTYTGAQHEYGMLKLSTARGVSATLLLRDCSAYEVARECSICTENTGVLLLQLCECSVAVSSSASITAEVRVSFGFFRGVAWVRTVWITTGRSAGGRWRSRVWVWRWWYGT